MSPGRRPVEAQGRVRLRQVVVGADMDGRSPALTTVSVDAGQPAAPAGEIVPDRPGRDAASYPNARPPSTCVVPNRCCSNVPDRLLM